MERVEFFKENKKIYFKYNEEIKEYNAKNRDLLKKQLELPYEVELLGFTRIEMGTIITALYENDVEIKGERITEMPNDTIHFKVTFYKKDVEDIKIRKRIIE
jgi:hypothetical protein